VDSRERRYFANIRLEFLERETALISLRQHTYSPFSREGEEKKERKLSLRDNLSLNTPSIFAYNFKLVSPLGSWNVMNQDEAD